MSDRSGGVSSKALRPLSAVTCGEDKLILAAILLSSLNCFVSGSDTFEDFDLYRFQILTIRLRVYGYLVADFSVLTITSASKGFFRKF